MATVSRRIQLLIALCGLSLAGCTPSDPQDLLVHCGGGLRLPISELIEQFEQQHHVRIVTNYDGSERLIGALLVSRRGDVIIPGDRYYIDVLERENLIETRQPICAFVPVILVARDSTFTITSLPDLLQPGIKLGLGDERACAIGRLSRNLFEQNGIAWTSVVNHLSYSAGKVDELGQHIELGSLDATIVWDATAHQFSHAGRMIPIPYEQNLFSSVEAGVLSVTEHRALAVAFVEFLAAPESQVVFAKHGFHTEIPVSSP